MATRVPSRPVETRSTTPHSQIASSSRPVRCRQPGRALRRSPFERVLPHDDAEVVLGLGEQPVRVDELEAVGRLERVPLVDVAVHEHGPLVSVGLAAAALRTRVRGRPRHDCRGRSSSSHIAVMNRPSLRAFSSPVGQPRVGRRPPDPLRRGDEDLVPGLQRQRRARTATGRAARAAARLARCPLAAAARSLRRRPGAARSPRARPRRRRAGRSA